MCALQLDLFDKKKEAPQALDLSRSVITSEADFRRLLEKVPEYKIRPEKVRPEDLKVREKDFTFHARRRELRRKRESSYANPCPPEMRSVKLEDLSSVAIDWKMLTSLRPKSKQDEDMFSRLVYMSRMHLRTAAAAKKGAAAETAALIRRGKNRAGILETKVVVCKECGDEFCTGSTCGKFLYECFARVDVPEAGAGGGVGSPGAAGAAKERGRSKSSKKKSTGRKARSRKRSGSSKRRPKKSKSKSPSKVKRKSSARSPSRSTSRSPSRSPSKSPSKRASKSVPRIPPKGGTRNASESLSRIPSKSPSKSQSKGVSKSVPRIPSNGGPRDKSESPSRSPFKNESSKPGAKKKVSLPTQDKPMNPSTGAIKRRVRT